MSTVIRIRPFDKEKDAGFIFSTWPKGAYYGALVPIEEPKSDWFKSFFLHVKAAIERPGIFEITIACMWDDRDTIIGYSVINGSCLEWIYVKEHFRQNGIAKLLIKNKKIETVTNLTKVGNAIATKMGLKEKRVTQKEEPNGTEQGRTEST